MATDSRRNLLQEFRDTLDTKADRELVEVYAKNLNCDELEECLRRQIGEEVSGGNEA